MATQISMNTSILPKNGDIVSFLPVEPVQIQNINRFPIKWSYNEARDEKFWNVLLPWENIPSVVHEIFLSSFGHKNDLEVSIEPL